MDTTGYGFVKEGKVYLKSSANYPEREVGEVVESEEASLNYFTQRFKVLEKKVNDLAVQVKTSENKGSFLMKIIHLKEQLLSYNAIGDYEMLLTTLIGLESYITELILSNRLRNSEIKKVLIEELKMLIAQEETDANAEKVKDIQKRWIKTGRVAEEEEEKIESEFKQLTNQFFASINDVSEAKNELIQYKVDQLKSLIAEAERMLNDGNYLRDTTKFKQLQVEWKKVGSLPKVLAEELWADFKKVGDQFFENVKKAQRSSKSQQKQDVQGFLKTKDSLLAKVKSFLKEDAQKVYPDVRKMIQEWKNINKTARLRFSDQDKEFFETCAYITEKSYVLLTVNKRNPDFAKKTLDEQRRLQEQALKYLISRDQEELDQYKQNAEKITIAEKSDFNKILFIRLRDLEQKIKVKSLILKDLSA